MNAFVSRFLETARDRGHNPLSFHSRVVTAADVFHVSICIEHVDGLNKL